MITIRGQWYRGGTSKCWFFDRADVTASGLSDTDLLVAAFGGADHRQIDGVGGATSTTSKAAIIEATPNADTHLTYLFAQVGIGDGSVEYLSNCGNCASAVALYAVQNGIVAPTGDVTEVRMYNENSHSVLVGKVATPGGEIAWQGEDVIPGHDVTGVRVDLGFEEPGGRSTGQVSPTGNSLDELSDADGMLMRATLVDAGAPACLIPASDLGLTAGEALDAFAASVPELKKWQRAGALAMGLAKPEDPISDSVPKVGIVGAPVDYTTTRGEQVSAGDYDVAVRMVSMHAPHPAIGITSAVAVAAAAALPGSSVARLLQDAPAGDELVVRLGTPAGVIETAATTAADGSLSLVTTKRVARRIAVADIELPLS